MIAGNRYAGWVYLCKAGVSKQRTFFMGAPCSRNVRAFRVRGKEKHVAVSASAKEHRVGAMSFDFASYQIPCDDPTRLAIRNNQIQHLGPVVHLHLTIRYLTVEGAI